MAGELASVLTRSWKDIWLPLSRRQGAPADLFNELVSELSSPPAPPDAPIPPPLNAFDADGVLVDPQHLTVRGEYEAALATFAMERQRYESATSGGDGRPFFRRLLEDASRSEASAVRFFQECYSVLAVYDDFIQSQFRVLSLAFFRRYSLGYNVGEDLQLYPTMAGVFSRLFEEVRTAAATIPHAHQLFDEFEEAYRDLKMGRTEARLKTCLLRQFNLLEALGRAYPGVTAQTLGAMCDQLNWPHSTIREVGKKLYGFRSDYPGLGHAGNPQSVLGPIQMKDFVSISMMLTSFTPYFLDHLDGEKCYGG
jgi:hypothetical protein